MLKATTTTFGGNTMFSPSDIVSQISSNLDEFEDSTNSCQYADIDETNMDEKLVVMEQTIEALRNRLKT